MSRPPKPPPGVVERLAQECADLRGWLCGPGTAADPEAFKVALRAYLALCNAVMLLPRGGEALLKARAVDHHRPVAPITPSSYFDAKGDRAAMLVKPVLTDKGWIVPNQPDQLVAHVARLQEEAKEAGRESTAKATLRSIIHRLAEHDGESALRAEQRQLGALEKRLSVARKSVTNRPKKVPPKGR